MASFGPFEGVSNRATWFAGVEMIDATDDSLIDFTGATATMTLRSESNAETVIASTDAGTLTFPEAGYAVWNIPTETMLEIAAGTYALGILATREGVEVQIVLARLPILEGL